MASNIFRVDKNGSFGALACPDGFTNSHAPTKSDNNVAFSCAIIQLQMKKKRAEIKKTFLISVLRFYCSAKLKVCWLLRIIFVAQARNEAAITSSAVALDRFLNIKELIRYSQYKDLDVHHINYFMIPGNLFFQIHVQQTFRQTEGENFFILIVFYYKIFI